MSAVKKSHDAKTSTPANLSQARDGSVASSLDVGENSAVGKVSTEEQGADVSMQHKSAFVSFLGQLSSFSGDLSSITCPSFMLNGISILEYFASYNDHPKYLAEITNSPVPEDRMLSVVRWFVSSLYGSYHERCANGTEKKPYNPVLGEQFFMDWSDSGNEGWESMHLICEQVSHHPPVSAFHLNCEKAQIYVDGHNAQKSKYKGTTIKVEQVGRITVHDLKNNETYTISLPTIHIRGLFTGTIFLELSGITQFVSSNGCTASIEYIAKPWFVGEYFGIKGSVFGKNQTDQHSSSSSSLATPVYTITGKWTEISTVKSTKTGASSELFNASQVAAPKTVKPRSEQGELESRLVWSKVTDCLQQVDFNQASKNKGLLEESQRKIRREREKQDTPWSPAHFNFLPDVEEQNAVTSSAVSANMDVGMWAFHDQKH